MATFRARAWALAFCIIAASTGHALDLAGTAMRSIPIVADKFEARRTRHAPILVIHETAASAGWVYSRVNHPSYQASFHAFIPRDGSIVWMVPSDKTAYTAGRSKFRQPGGLNPITEWDPSGYGTPTVNHFAFQVELESPPDGYWCAEPHPPGAKCRDGGGRHKTHSGYTPAQYQALAWLAVKTGIPRDRITTHAAVDITGHKDDPRSFDWTAFWNAYDAVPDRTPTVALGIPPAAQVAENGAAPEPAPVEAPVPSASPTGE